MTLPELSEAFLVANQSRFRTNTSRAYGYDLDLFARAHPRLAAQKVTVEHLRAFLQVSTDLAPSSLARRQSALKSCFAWAYRNDLIPSDPSAKLDPVRIPARDPWPLSEDQVEAILAAIPASDQRNRLLFTMLCETGMRVGEALGLHLRDIHLNQVDGGFLRVVGKGDQERLIPLIDSPRTVRLLRPMVKKLGAVGPLFRGDPRKGGRPGEAVEYATVYYHFERYLAQAAAKHPQLFAEEPDPITIHRLRHTYATTKLRDGVSLPAVRKLMGHKNVQTTLRYAATDLETIKRELVEARRRRG